MQRDDHTGSPYDLLTTKSDGRDKEPNKQDQNGQQTGGGDNTLPPPPTLAVRDDNPEVTYWEGFCPQQNGHWLSQRTESKSVAGRQCELHNQDYPGHGAAPRVPP
jgi:hypothetical protein